MIHSCQIISPPLPSFLPPGGSPLRTLLLPVPSGLGGVTLPNKDVQTVPLLSNPFLLTTYTLHKTKQPAASQNNGWYLVPLEVKLTEGQRSLLLQVFLFCVCVCWCGGSQIHLLVSSNVEILAVVLFPPRFEVIFQFGKGWKHLILPLKLSNLLASIFKFLIFDWIKVTRQSKELSVDIPDQLCTLYFLLLFFIIWYRWEWAYILFLCLPLGRDLFPQIKILWENPTCVPYFLLNRKPISMS